ncbi:hypothetical protein [Nocardia vermiculata]|uniref:Uncharacterized protein n=1 Tax=Nocardia vermiculata TaxID=257274 RepID=A0A846XW07_9NOCA|nr:hypothetical protein [Nocardia vermiculata]NKY50172.1 hypothetical protein [Nocardia vermiculata]
MTAPPPPDIDLAFFLPSTCRQCPASGCGPQHDHTEDPQAITWRRGAKHVTCEYECRVCGCTWTDTWPTWGFFGAEIPQ